MQAWTDTPELQATSLNDFWLRICHATLQMDRWEFEAVLAGETVGAASFCLDDDIHVGRCLSMQWQFINPEYRNQGITRRFFRQMLELARELEVPFCAWAHHKAPWTYETKYRRVPSGKESNEPRLEG